MGLRRVTWAPRISEASAEIATMVGLCLMRDFQMSRNRSEEASPSQSITSRSVLPTANMPRAWEDLRQRFVLIDNSRRSPLTVEKTAGSREMNKHSKALSGVISVFRSGSEFVVALHPSVLLTGALVAIRVRCVRLQHTPCSPPLQSVPRSLGIDCPRRLPVLGQLKAPALRLDAPLVLQVSAAMSSSYSGLDSETGPI